MSVCEYVCECVCVCVCECVCVCVYGECVSGECVDGSELRLCRGGIMSYGCVGVE